MNSLSVQPATYVYGVAPAEPFRDPPLRVPGIGGRVTVRTIVHEDLVAVVSDVPEFDVGLKRENLLDHQRVLDEVLRRSDVLPFSFGTVAGSDEEVREVLLRDGYHALHEQLDYIRGCVELELKVVWDESRLFAEIAQENDEVRELRDMIAELPDDEVAAEKLALGQLTETEIELKSEWEADGLLDVLQEHAVDVLVNANMSDIMVLNAAFLVEREHEDEFDGAIYGLAEAHKGRLLFSYVGPLPPYSFINLAFESEG
jgi:gas vesicle protein GvpL/GvpF